MQSMWLNLNKMLQKKKFLKFLLQKASQVYRNLCTEEKKSGRFCNLLKSYTICNPCFILYSVSLVVVGCGWQSYVAYINIGCYYFVGLPLGLVMGWVFDQGVMGIWAGMIFGGTAVQTLILAIVTIRCDWEKEAAQATMRVNKWKASPVPEFLVLHVDQLSRNVNENHLKEIFGTFGEVVNVRVAMHHAVKLPKRFAYVEFKSMADAEKAQE